jgi:uncharacterized phage-associated protein
MATANAVANFLLYLQEINKNVSDISNLKLQKLLYYCQGTSYNRFGLPLFDEDLEAWQYGPVVPSIYKNFSHFGNKRIKVNINDSYILQTSSELTKEEIEVILVAWKKYAYKSAGMLVESSHRELPWLNAWNNGHRIINRDDIRRTFSNTLVQ